MTACDTEALEATGHIQVKSSDLSDVACRAAYVVRCKLKGEEYDKEALKDLINVIEPSIKTFPIESRADIKGLADPAKAKVIRQAVRYVIREEKNAIELLDYCKGYIEKINKIIEDDSQVSEPQLTDIRKFCLSLARSAMNSSSSYLKKPSYIQ